MATILKAQAREDLRNSATKQIRQEGNVPAILYGKKIDNKTVSVGAMDLLKTIREVGRNGLISLDIDGSSKHQVMIYDMQIDPIRNEYTHIDFFEVDMTSEIDVDVPVRLVGEAEGLRDGGIVSQLLYEITVNCLPSDIPEEIEIDIAQLNIGDAIQVADIRSNVQVTIVNEDEDAIVTVQAPAAEVEDEQVSEEDEVKEPEVIGEETEEE